MIEQHACQAEMFVIHSPRICRKQAKYYENGKYYCGFHAPSRIKARKEKRDNDLKRIREKIERLEKEASYSEYIVKSNREKADELRNKLAKLEK